MQRVLSGVVDKTNEALKNEKIISTFKWNKLVTWEIRLKARLVCDVQVRTLKETVSLEETF